MQDKVRVSLIDLVLSISNVIDLVSSDIKEHHARVACAALSIAREMQREVTDLRELVLAGLLHDIAILSDEERRELLVDDGDNVHDHAVRGWMLLREFGHMEKVARIIRFHHVSWSFAGMEDGGDAIPMASHILHLADGIDAHVARSRVEILDRVDDIVAAIKNESGRQYAPLAVDAFERLARRDSFWLDMVSPGVSQRMVASVKERDIELDGEDLQDFARLMARVIDFRCSFTAMHSSCVARVSAALAAQCGMPYTDCRKIELAGYLHDIGKLAIPRELLEKNGRLDPDEYNHMRTHVYYTRRVLEHITGMEDVVTWASQHHERLDASGYPDSCHGREIPLGSRIIAVADVFTALSEQRPYRGRKSSSEVVTTLQSLADRGKLDARLVGLLLERMDIMEGHRERAEHEVAHQYGAFTEAMQMAI